MPRKIEVPYTAKNGTPQQARIIVPEEAEFLEFEKHMAQLRAQEAADKQAGAEATSGAELTSGDESKLETGATPDVATVSGAESADGARVEARQDKQRDEQEGAALDEKINEQKPADDFVLRDGEMTRVDMPSDEEVGRVLIRALDSAKAASAEKPKKLSRRERREAEPWHEQQERDDWYEKLRAASDAHREGEWMTEEEKIEKGLVKPAKGFDALEAYEWRRAQERAERIEKNGGVDNLWEVQHYELKTPKDAWTFTNAAAEVMHYEKNTVVGTQNLEVKFAPGEEETWEAKRYALIAEHWEWVKSVLAQHTYQERRNVQDVYTDYVDYLHDSGNSKDSFTDYLEKAVPECTIEPTKANLAELEEMSGQMRENLLETTNVYGDRYYSDREVVALMNVYGQAIDTTEHDLRVRQIEGKLEKNKSQGTFLRIANKVLHRNSGDSTKASKKVQSVGYADAEVVDSAGTKIIDFPEKSQSSSTNEDSEESVKSEAGTKSLIINNKPINLERLLPDEGGIEQLQTLADFCAQKWREARRISDDAHDALAAKWEEDYVLLLNHVSYSRALLENKRKEDAEKRERRAVMKIVEQNWKMASAEAILKNYSDSYELNADEPIYDQLLEAKETFQTQLNAAMKNKDFAKEAIFLGKIGEVNSVLLSFIDGDGTVTDEKNDGPTTKNTQQAKEATA